MRAKYENTFDKICGVNRFRFDCGFWANGRKNDRAQGGFACVVALAVLLWAIASAFIAVAAPRGKWLFLLVVADFLMFLNHAGIGIKEFTNSGFAAFVWQGGQYWRLSGVWLGVAWQLLVTIPLLLSATWFALRVSPQKRTEADLTEPLN